MPSAMTIGARIRGKYYDFSSIEITVDGGVQPHITDISYSHKLDPGMLRGTSAKPRGRTRGTYEASGNFTIYKEDYELLKPKLVKAGRGGYMCGEFDIVIVYSDGIHNNTDRLMSCRIVGEDNSHNQGNDALLVKVDLSIMEIVTNGLSAVDEGVGKSAGNFAIPSF